MQPALVVAVAAAGGLGAVLRFLGSVWVQHWWPHAGATALVNVLGCFGFGFCWAFGQSRWSPTVAAAVLAGFFGAFTTFSTFAHDCQQLLVARRHGALLLNVLAQNVLGVAALWVGMRAAGR